MTSSSFSYRRPIGRIRGGLRDALVLSGVAALTTWVALLSWKGFALNWGGFMGPLVVVAIVVAASGALLRWLRVPAALVVLAQIVIVGVLVCLQLTGAPLPLGENWTQLNLLFTDASTTAQSYRAPVPRGVRSHRPAADLRRRGLHAPRRHRGRHPASRAARRAAAAHRLQRPGEPAGRRRLLDHLHADHDRLPGDALPPGVPPDRPVGPPTRPGRRQRPQRVRGEQRRAALVGRSHRRSGDRPRDRHPAVRADVRVAAVRQRVRTGRRRPGQDREPDDRPEARPQPRSGRRHDHRDDRRPRPVVPADRRAQPVLRQRVDLRGPEGPHRPAGVRPAAVDLRAVVERAAQGVQLRRQRRAELQLDLAADRRADLPHRRRRRLALRPQHDGLHGVRRRHERQGRALHDDVGRARPRPARPQHRQRLHRPGRHAVHRPARRSADDRDPGSPGGHRRSCRPSTRRPWRCRTGSATTSTTPSRRRRATAPTPSRRSSPRARAGASGTASSSPPRWR